MNINWRRLFIAIGIILVTAAMAGYSTYLGVTNTIGEQNRHIDSLENQVDKLSNQITKKIEEQKAKEAAAKAAAEAAAKKSQPSESTGSQPAPEEPEATSQIFYFYDPDCGTCKAQHPIVVELQGEGIPFVFMDVAANPNYISEYGISAVPTFILNEAKQAAFFTKPELLNFWNTYK